MLELFDICITFCKFCHAPKVNKVNPVKILIPALKRSCHNIVDEEAKLDVVLCIYFSIVLAFVPVQLEATG